MENDSLNQPHETDAPQPAAAFHESDTLQTLMPTKNMPSLLAYYFGVFGLIPFLGLPLSVAAIILGKKGLNQFKKQPSPGAKGHAMTGLVLGIMELVVFALFVLLMIIVGSNSWTPKLSWNRESRKRD